MLTSAVTFSILAAIAASQEYECDTYAPAPDVCPEEGICVEGRGLQLYSGDDTSPWLYQDLRGAVTFPSGRPEILDGLDFLTYDNFPDYTPDDKRYSDSKDSRTDEVIQRIQSDKAVQLVIALDSPDAAGNGWERINTHRGADFVLDNDGDSYNDDLEYWIYTYDYNEPQTWLDMPEQADDALPPFVFGPADELRFANPLPLPEGVIIDESSLIANPSLWIVPGTDNGGDIYLACASGVPLWKVWRSTDKGETWERWSKFKANLNRQTIFAHNGSVYVMGTLKHPDRVDDPNAMGIIYRSTDGGQTFEDSTLLPFDGGDAPSNIQYAEGRIWKAVPGPTANGAWGSTLASAPVDSDLMDVNSWTVAVASDGEGNEGVTMLSRDGVPINVAQNDRSRDDAAMIYADGYKKTEFDPETDRSPLLHNGKFSMQYDEVSDKYWALTNGEGALPRNIITMYSSDDLESWTLEREVLYGPSSRFHGFNYPNMLIDGDDIVYVLRTAWENSRGRSNRWHDGNMFTFHRIENFRS